MSRCKHNELSLLEVIDAGTRHWFEGGKLKHNNEYGTLLYRKLECMDCKKTWRVNKHLPPSLRLRLNEFDEILARGD